MDIYFTHEYIHFLQDISTYVGINNAYVYSEHIHGLVSSVYCIPQGRLHIPVNMPNNYSNVDLNRFVNTEGMGTLTVFDEFFLKLKRNIRRFLFKTNMSID